MMEVFILILLIFLNGFFSANEMAFISLNDAKVEFDSKNGNKKAIKIKGMLENPSKFLSTIQIGITFAGFLSSAFAAEKFAKSLAPYLFDMFSFFNYDLWNTISIVVITVILSYFTLIFGELVPKRIAMKNSEAIAYRCVDVIRFISFLMSPFVRFLTFSTDVVSSLFGVSDDDEEGVTEEEIRMMVDVGEEKGTIDIREKKMINNVFEFNDKEVSEIMVPRTEVYALNMNLSISEVIGELQDDFRYSRIPVYEDSIDNIKGIVYVKDILISSKNKNSKIKNLVKDAYLIPENMPINKLFENLRKNRRQIAVVVDEYGGTSGLVTMEDILEEIVGEIYDEYDIPDDIYKKINGNTYLLSGSMAIYDVENLTGVEIPNGNFDTLSGYIVEKLGRIPSDNEMNIKIKDEHVTYVVMEVKDRRINKVKAIIKK